MCTYTWGSLYSVAAPWRGVVLSQNNTEDVLIIYTIRALNYLSAVLYAPSPGKIKF